VNVTGSSPYVSLSQIPYTGFDFGATGNAIYWMGILMFALSGAYLVIYYRGGAGAFAASLFGGSGRKYVYATAAAAPQERASFSAAPLAYAAAPVKRTQPVVETQTVAQAPVERALPSYDHKATTDALVIERSVGGEMPRITIARA
jgi:hypothetical protein